MNIHTSPQDTNDSNPAPIKASKPIIAEVIIDPTLIAQLKKDLAKIGTQPIEGITKRGAIILLVNEITDARARKVSFKAIEEALKARGIFISAATIGTYWRQAMADIEAAKPKPAKTVPAVTPAVAAPMVDLATPEPKSDEREAPKSPLVFRDITDDDEFEDNAAMLRRIRNDRPATGLDERE